MTDTVTIPEAQAGTRLDVALASLGFTATRSAAQKIIQQGRVLLDGRPAKKGEVVTTGQQLQVAALTEAPPAEAHEPAVPFTVVYEDDAVIVVDKPAGLVVHPAAGHDTGTLSQALAGRASGGDPDRPGIVHRLDRDTSGLLVVAKGDDALRELQAQLQDRSMRREYLALVQGAPESATGTIDAPLGRDAAIRTRISIQTDKPRDAVTHFALEQRLTATSLLRIWLETGRTHQIRAHLKEIGLPVCGDPEYGSPGIYGLKRQFLHAAKLAFTHPVSGATVEFESPLPDDLSAALQLARAE